MQGPWQRSILVHGLKYTACTHHTRSATAAHLELNDVADVRSVHRPHVAALHLGARLEVHVKAAEQGGGQLGTRGPSARVLAAATMLGTLRVIRSQLNVWTWNASTPAALDQHRL